MTDRKKLTISPMKPSRKMVLLARGVVLLVFAIWVAGIFYFHYRMKETERQILEMKQKEQQQEEFLRRQAVYQQASMERQTVQSSVQNAVDAFKQ